MRYLFSILALSILSSASSKVINLTDDNYERLTEGKALFIKFFAPWCGHCKAMAEDWEKLAAEWAGNETGLVAEVDCTAEETKALCSGVEGFPTLRYGDPGTLDDYSGGREYESLSAFAKENLKPTCGLSNLDLCDEETKKKIEEYQAMSGEELWTLAKKVHQTIHELETVARGEVAELESQINEIIDEYTKESEQMKVDSNYKHITAVLSTKEPEDDEDDENDGDDGKDEL